MSSDAPSQTRPEAPDDRLLAEAAAKWAVLLGEPATTEVGWDVGPRMDRVRSSVFPLRATAGNREFGSAFYKVMLPSTKGNSERRQLRVDRARTGLMRTMGLDDRLADVLRDEPITFSRALAIDSESLTTVTLGVAGNPFGNVTRHLTTRSRRDQALKWMEITGRAAFLIEQCTIGVVDDREDERSDLMDRRVERVTSWLGPGVGDRLRCEIDDLYEQAMASARPLTYAHGDFSPTNLLVGDGIGLIDFEWIPRLRVFDLANLVFRLEFDTPLPIRVLRPLIGAALRGYGERDVVATPHWRLHRLSNLMKFVAEGPRPWYEPRSARTRRAATELTALVGKPLNSR